MDGINLINSLQTDAIDTKSNIRSEIADLSRATLQNALANTPQILTPTLISDKIDKPDFSKMSDEDYTKNYLRGTLSDVFYKNPAIKRAPIFSDYNYAKKYDDPVLGFNAYRGYQEQEDLYADYLQSGFVGGLTTGLKGLTSRALSIVPKIAAGFGHVGGAAIDILDGDAFKGQWNYAIDNSFARMMHNADDKLREAMPIYADADYFNGGMWDKVMTGKFMADDMLDGIAYAASSMVNVPILGTIGKGLSAVGKGLNTVGRIAKVGKLTEPIAGFAKTFANETSLGNTLLKANKALQESKVGTYLTAPVEGSTRIANWAKTGGYTMFNTFSEAGAEAYDLKKTMKEELIQSGLSEEEAEKYATERAQETFNGNLIGLWASNLWELKTIFPKMFNTAADDIKAMQRKIRLGEINPDELKIFNKEVLKKVGTGIAIEGFYEENFQTSLQQYEKNKLFNTDDEGFFDSILGTVSLMGKNASAFFKGATGGYQSLSKDEKEGADSILLGALIGLGMGAGGQVINNMKERTTLKNYKNSYLEYGKYQHGLFTLLADDKRNILKSFTKTNPDGTTKRSYLNDNNEHEYDQDNIAKLMLFNLDNKKLYNEYLQRVAMGDEVGASFLLDQAFARLAYQAVNNKFWQGDTKSAIEDLKLKIKDFEFDEDKEDLNMRREVEKRLSIIDKFSEISDSIDDQLKEGFDLTSEEGLFQHTYSRSAMFYEATKLESLKRIQQQFAEGALAGDVAAKNKFDQLELLIEDATNTINQFATKDSRKTIFDNINALQEKELDYGKQKEIVDKELEDKNAERAAIITNAEGRELTDDEKTSLETINNELVTINEKIAKAQYERLEYISKTDTYTLYNRLVGAKNIKSHKDVLEKFRITKEGMVYFRTLNDKKITDSVREDVETMGLDKLVPPSPLSGTRVEVLNKLRSDKTFFVDTIMALDKIKGLLDKLKNKTNFTPEDNALATTLIDAYRALYAGIYSPDLENIKETAEDQLKDFVSTIINSITIVGVDPVMEMAIKAGTIDQFLDYDVIVDAFKNNGISNDVIQSYTDLYEDVANIKDLIDSVLSRPSSLDPMAASSSTWSGHSFNPADYNAITITQYEALADKDAWLNRSIMVELISDADATVQLFTSLRDSDNLEMFDTNPQKIRLQLQILTGIKQSVSSTERKDKPEYEGVAAKVDELIEILEEAYKQSLENTNAREQEQQKYNSINKGHLFLSLGVVLNANDNTFEFDKEYDQLHTLIRDAIGSKFDELLQKAKEDTTDPFSQLYYEMILSEIRNAPASKADAIVNYLNTNLDKIEPSKHQVLKDRSVVLNPSITSPLYNQFYASALSWTGLRFMPKILEEFLKDANIINLAIEIKNIEDILNNPSSTKEQKDAANEKLKGYNDIDKKDAVTVDLDELTTLVESILKEQLLLQLRNDIEINKSLFTPSSYFNEQLALANSEGFSLSQQQRIAELELTKRFYGLKDTDPDVVLDKIFYLNAVAGSGKTSGVGRWFASKLGLEANEILVTSHLPKSSEVAAKQMNSDQAPTLIFDFLDAFKNRGTNTKIVVNGIEIDLTKIKLLVIDEMAALGTDQAYIDIINMVREINKLNGSNKFSIVGLGDINQLSGDAIGVNKMITPLKKITILPSLTISYRSSVTAISDAFNQFKGKTIGIKDGIVSASNVIGEDSFGVHAVNPSKDSVYDTITKQINASEGEKLIITTEAKKAEYQSKFPGVLVFTPEEAQSFTIDNVFIDLPLEANNTLYNKKMYVALSRASKYAMFIDYTESFNQNEDKNMRSIIELDRNQNEQKIELNKKNYISLLDHYLSVLGAKSAGTTTSTTPVAGTGPIVTSTPTTPGGTPMTPEQIYDNHLDQYLAGTISGPMGNSLKELVDNNSRYFELARKFYLSQNGVGSFTAAEDSERSDLLKNMILSFTPEQEAAFDNFLNTLPC